MSIMMPVVYLLFKKIRDILPIFVHIVVELNGLSCVDSITVSVFVDILEFDTYRQVVQIGSSGAKRCK